MLSFWDLTWCCRCRQALPLHSSPPNSSEHKAYQLKEQFRKSTLCLKQSQWLMVLPIYYSRRKLQGEGSKANLLWLQLALGPPSALSRVCVAAQSVPTTILCTPGLLVFTDYSAKVVPLRLPARSSYDRLSETPWQPAIRKSSPAPDSMCHLLYS